MQEPTARELFLIWEKSRWICNVLLVCLLSCSSLPLGVWHDLLRQWEFYLVLLVANGFFCVGPTAEGYLCWFGMTRGTARATVFAIGVPGILWTVAGKLLFVLSPFR